MGLGVYVEDQMHRRERPGDGVHHALERLITLSRDDGLLAHIFKWGDTMFNHVQLQKLDIEVQELGSKNPGIQEDADLVRSAIESAMRKRGYIWISGD
ncbi:hypothetical protein H181DRAFT_01159 [Streptomyces sp. WMMB 714]|uniref:hypothetical protein n=1 Tax=Streptomyces sp. WMMB 714 TaxID=1286822 RepID=UPI0005F8039B|nr:hypothetical protein [Streptomyces sp. WMMB 714]SCK17335.1 hypothetical protein H181DRAFT_01159 [Streptomyces sp. WMMB 714]